MTIAPDAKQSVFSIETTGIEVIAESERKGKPSSLFWPWFASNISVFSIAYGAWILGFAISFWQATIVAVAGSLLSFLLVGIVSLAGKRGSAPTLVLSRAPFGVHGNLVPGVVSYLLLVGWETILVALATLATDTVLNQLGWHGGNVTKIVAFLIVVAIVVGAGVIGFDMVMRVQKWLTIVLGVMTVGYIALTWHTLDFDAIKAVPGGSLTAMLGAFIMVMTGLGLGWVNCAADYSRYLPRSASSAGVVWWTTISAAVAPIILIVFGLMIVASNPDLAGAIDADPVGAIATLLPTWYLIPFVIVAVGGFAAGAVLDIYSSGLTLLAIGLRIPRWMAAGIDGCIMIVGTIIIVWVAADFWHPFEAFLITLGVPIAAWAGGFIGDLLLRRRDYDEPSLFTARGVYGRVNWLNVGAMLVFTAAGWGLVQSDVMTWQGYLFTPLHLDVDTWGYSNVGVLVALLGGFVVAICQRGRVRRQEAGQASGQIDGHLAGRTPADR